MTGAGALALVALAALAPSAGTADDLLRDGDGPPGAGLAPLHHTRTAWDPDRIGFTLRTRAGEAVLVTLTRAEDGPDGAPAEGPYAIAVTVDPPEAAEALAPAIARVVARIRANAADGPSLRRARPPPADGGARPADARRPATAPPSAFRAVPAADRTARAELWLCLALLALAVLTLPRALGLAGRALAPPGARLLGRPAAAWLLAALAAAVAVQLLVPTRLVTVFAGYGAVAEAWALRPVAKYGAATTALYGPLLAWLGPSTDVVVAVNRAAGLLALPLAAALAARLAGRAASGWVALAFVALAPALLRDRASESILVPMQLWLLASLVHADAWLGARRPLDAAGAVLHGALALHARPEAWLALPLLLGALAALEGRWRDLLRRPAAPAVLALALLALGAPRLLSLLHFAEAAAGTGDVPGLARPAAGGVLDRFLHGNALWMPQVHAVTATLLAAAALPLAGRGRRLACGLVLLAILGWQALSTFDLPPVSIPRVQAPALLWTLVLAAGPIGRGLAAPAPAARVAAAALGLLVLVPSPSTLRFLWQPTNAQAFDGFWRRALPALPPGDGPRCVVALQMSDPPRDIVIRQYPLYEVAARSGSLRVFSLETFLEAPDAARREGCELLYLQGPQCFARFHGWDAPPPPTAEPLPGCAAIHARFRLEPLHVEDVPNEGNADFPYYGASPTLRYGLWRVGPPAGGG